MTTDYPAEHFYFPAPTLAPRGDGRPIWTVVYRMAGSGDPTDDRPDRRVTIDGADYVIDHKTTKGTP